MLSLSDTQAAYLAGLFDGEACFTFMRQSRSRSGVRGSYDYPMITLSMTHEPTIAHVAKMLGYAYSTSGSKKGPRWKPAYRFNIYGRKAQQLCALMLPYLITKRAQAEILLAFGYPAPSRAGKQRGHVIIAPPVIAQRNALVSQIRVLNKRGR